jgi:hypothetical protein
VAADEPVKAAEASDGPDSHAEGTLVLRVLPANSKVVFGGVEMRDSCWRGCSLPEGTQSVTLLDPGGRKAVVQIRVPANARTQCVYSFDTAELDCR